MNNFTKILCLILAILALYSNRFYGSTLEYNKINNINQQLAPYSYEYVKYSDLGLPGFGEFEKFELAFAQNYLSLLVFMHRSIQWMDYLDFITKLPPQLTGICALPDNTGITTSPQECFKKIKIRHTAWYKTIYDNYLSGVSNNISVMNKTLLQAIIQTYYKTLYPGVKDILSSYDGLHQIDSPSSMLRNTDQLLYEMNLYFLESYDKLAHFSGGFFVSFAPKEALSGVSQNQKITPVQAMNNVYAVTGQQEYNIRLIPVDDTDQDSLKNAKSLVWYPIMCYGSPTPNKKENYTLGFVLTTYCIFTAEKDGENNMYTHPAAGWTWLLPNGYFASTASAPDVNTINTYPIYPAWLTTKNIISFVNPQSGNSDAGGITYNTYSGSEIYDDPSTAAGFINAYYPMNIKLTEATTSPEILTPASTFGFNMFRTDGDSDFINMQKYLDRLWENNSN